MHAELFTLCDAATIDRGKLNVLGSFDSIRAPAFPCDHPMCAIACKLRFDMGEDGHHTLDISFSDPDMRPVTQPIRHEFDVNIGNMPSHSYTYVHHYFGFHLERPGEYYFDLRVDGTDTSRIPLYVGQIAPPTV